jgi:hypothetical protein
MRDLRYCSRPSPTICPSPALSTPIRSAQGVGAHAPVQSRPGLEVQPQLSKFLFERLILLVGCDFFVFHGFGGGWETLFLPIHQIWTG